MYVGSVPQVLSSVQAGTVKPLAVTSETRSKALPDVPTVVAEGLEEAVFDIWWGVFTASGTPPEVVEKINAGINAGMTRSEGRRGGKECFSTCRSRLQPYHYTKQTTREPDENTTIK